MRLYEKYEASVPALLPKQNNRDAFFLYLRQVFNLSTSFSTSPPFHSVLASSGPLSRCLSKGTGELC